MITVISGTNRRESECLNFARQFQHLLMKKEEQPINLLALEEIPHDWFHIDMYEKEGQSETIRKIQDGQMIPAEKFLILTPEYNGSFPGALKLFLDACSVRKYNDTFKGKKAALVGIATGRAGNLRGMDHLTGILNHLGVIVMPNKLPISRIAGLVDEDKEITDPATLKAVHAFVEEFLAF